MKLMLAAGCGLSALCGLVKTEDFAALVQSLTALIAGDTTTVGQMDLLPATDILWTEN